MMSSSTSRISLLCAALASVLAGCAAVTAQPGVPAVQLPVAAQIAAPSHAASAAAPHATAASAPGAGAFAPAPRPPSSPAPFAEVIRGAKSVAGFLTVWTKDEKTWLEVPAESLDKPFFFGSSLSSGLGQGFFLPGLMGSEHIVVLHRAGNNLQLIARSTHARAPAGSPLARTLTESYSDSLLASAPLAAAPHADRKSLLVDAMALLGGDLSGAQTALEAAFRMPYSLDRANSEMVRTRTSPDGTLLTVRAHFAVPKLPVPPVPNPGAPPPNPATLPNPPSTLPDARSLFLSFAYTLAPLPAQPMRPRLADQRVGYFTEAYVDFGNDSSDGRRVHQIARWRLEKKDPAAAVSEPKTPIRAVMDRNIPEKWRDPVRAGILEWNIAFERAGLRNAIAVEQQPADADWSSMEGTRMLAVRWFAMEGPGAVAVGPSQSDPRSGEIMRSAAIIPENWVRLYRALGADTEPRLPPSSAPELASPFASPFAPRLAQCSYAFDALEQAAFGLELLSARNGFDPQGPQGDRFINDALKEVVMHEVGHALGLRHNFKGSTGISQAQLRDAAFTRGRGISNSVMDYNPLNLPLQGEAAADYAMVTLGAYDFWAIEYGYRELAPDAEKSELAALGLRSEREPALAYGTDEDAFGFDPQANRFDLGEDPLVHARRQIKLARELWTLTQARELKADDDLSFYRRNLQRGLARINQSMPLVVKHIGGATTSRQLAGSGQALVTPVPAERQREALELLVGEYFASSSFRFEPKFMSRLGINQFERSGPNRIINSPDFSLPNAVLAIQRSALDALMSDGLATRLADAESKVADPRSLLSYAEVQTRLADAVWGELSAPRPADGVRPPRPPSGHVASPGSVDLGAARRLDAAGRDIDSLRRNLQREHLKRLTGALLRPTSAAAADVRSVHRLVATRMAAELKRASPDRGWSDIARAHLAESTQTLAEALRAPLVKQGV